MLNCRHDGARLLEWRQRRGLTREEVAARSGLSCDHLTLLEWGFLLPSRRDLDRLEAALGDAPEVAERRSQRLVLVQGRVVDAVAADLVIAGSAEELARHFGVSTRAFRGALRELVAAGWVVVDEGPAGRLTVLWSGGGRTSAEGGR